MRYVEINIFKKKIVPKIYINVNIYIDNIMKLTHFLIDLILKYIYGYILVVLKLPQTKGKTNYKNLVIEVFEI